MGINQTDKTWISGEITKMENSLSTKFDTTVGELKGTIVELKEENARLRERLIKYDIAVDDLEQYGRRMSVRVEGIPWEEGETNDDLEKTMIAEFAKVGVKIEPPDIVRLHRSSKVKEWKQGRKVSLTKQCIIKFSNWRSREKFAGFNRKARAKPGTVRVNNDLTRRRLQLLTSARQRVEAHMKQLFTPEEIENGLPDTENVFAYANINSDLRMRIRGRVVSFNTLPELEAAVRTAFPDVATTTTTTA